MARISYIHVAAGLCLLYIFSSFSVSECKSENGAEDEDEDFPCLCTLSIHPICGVDGTTYPNICVARCKHIDVAHVGTCSSGKVKKLPRMFSRRLSRKRAWRPILDVLRRSCPCTFDWDPVCTEHKVTYSNACWAKCVGAKYRKGEC